MDFTDFNISIPAENTGQVRTICPECSPQRKPAHQNERDLAVNVTEGTWYCHHCGWFGSLSAKKDYQEYYRPEYNKTTLPDGVIDYFVGRGISQDVLQKFNIGYDAKQRAIMFPRIKQGEVVAIKYRTHDKKMWQSKNPEPCFYNYDRALNAIGKSLIITEGEIDTLSFAEAYLFNVVSVPNGSPSPTAKNLNKALEFLSTEYINNFDNVVLALDADEPGQHFTECLAEKIGKHKCYRVEYPQGCKDANDVLIQYGPEQLKELYRNAKPYPVDGLYTAKDIEQAIQNLYKDGLKPGVSTGWHTLDSLYTVRPCEMTVVTGLPGSGKSTFLDALMVNLNQVHSWKIAFCSPENWPIQRHAANIIEKITGRSFLRDGYYDGRLTEVELQKTINQMQHNFFFTQFNEDQMNIDNILNTMRAAISRYGVKGIVLDPWNELETSRPTDINETEYVSQALGKIRRFARLNDVHVWIVAHPAKMRKKEDGTYPVPNLYDISGSANWNNKADNGLVIFRPDHRNDDVQVHIKKIRFKEIGRLGQTTLRYAKDCGRFADLTPQERLEKKNNQNNETDAPF